LRREDEDEQPRHRQHHHARIADGVGQHVGRGAQCAQQVFGEEAAEHGDDDADGEPEHDRGASDRLDAVRLLGAPGLADEHRAAGADADDQRDEEEDDRKHCGGGGQRLGAEHLADEDAVEGAGERLQDVAGDHRAEEARERAPERRVGDASAERRWVELRSR
jgi:hypothetical protein